MLVQKLLFVLLYHTHRVLQAQIARITQSAITVCIICCY